MRGASDCVGMRRGRDRRSASRGTLPPVGGRPGRRTCVLTRRNQLVPTQGQPGVPRIRSAEEIRRGQFDGRFDGPAVGPRPRRGQGPWLARGAATDPSLAFGRAGSLRLVRAGVGRVLRSPDQLVRP